MTVSGIPAIPDTVVKGHITSQPEDLMQGMKKFWRSFPHHTYCLFKVIFSAQNRKELKKFISVPCNGIEHKEKGSHTNMRSRGLCSLIQMKGKKGRQADQTQRDRIRHPCCTGHCREKNVRRLPERRPGAGVIQQTDNTASGKYAAE